MVRLTLLVMLCLSGHCFAIAIHTGSLLEIQGVSGSREYAPIIDRSSLTVLGEQALPPAQPVGLDRLSTGDEEGQWIAFEGTVHSAEIRDKMLSLNVASGSVQVEVMTVEQSEEVYNRLIDAKVRVRGTVGPVFNQRRQLIGVNVYSPDLKYIDVSSACTRRSVLAAHYEGERCVRIRTRHRSGPPCSNPRGS